MQQQQQQHQQQQQQQQQQQKKPRSRRRSRRRSIMLFESPGHRRPSRAGAAGTPPAPESLAALEGAAASKGSER